MRVVDRDFNVLRMNDTFLNLAGVSRDEAAGRKCYDVFPGPLCRTPGCPLTRILAGKALVTCETEKKRSDGSRIPCIVTATPFRDSGGDVIGIVEDFKDITERKRAERKLAGIQKQIEFILGATKTGLDIIDPDFNLRYVHPGWQKIYGDPEGRKCYEYFMGRTEPCPGCGIPKALAGKAPFVSEEILVREGNRPIQVTTIPFQDEHGDWLVAEVNVDITELKHAQDELKKHRDHLQELVAERTAELTERNTRLRQEVAERKQAEDALSTLNAQLEQRVEERTTQIAASLHEKVVLLHEIHHRVNNNLQIIVSLLNLQARYIRDGKVLNTLYETRNRVMAMALAHELIYRSEEVSRINFKSHFRSLVSHLFSSYGTSARDVSREIAMEDFPVDIDTAIPLGLIMNELVSNSL